MKTVAHLDSVRSSYIREILHLASSQQVISLAGGLPCLTTFPLKLIDSIMSDISQHPLLFQYSQTAGYPSLIENLKNRYQVDENKDILITSGSQQGLDLCTRAFVEKGDSIVVEAPSYLGAIQIFSMAQANILSVDQESDGPNLSQLESLFTTHTIRFFYAVPDFHNPTGCCWSLEKRQQVARLCQRYQVVLLEDSPYRELRFSGESLPTVSSLCPDQSITLYSLSKIVAPGLRVAALVAPKSWFDTLCKIKQAVDLHTSVPMQYLAFKILSAPEFVEHFAQTQRVYQRRHDCMIQELSELANYGCQVRAVDGGMFLWLTLPVEDSYRFARQALDKGVAIVPSTEFYSCPDKALPAARLNFTYQSQPNIKAAISRLKTLFEAL